MPIYQPMTPPAVVRPWVAGPQAVIVVPPSANPYRVAPLVPMQPMGTIVIQPQGPVVPGTPGFVVPIR